MERYTLPTEIQSKFLLIKGFYYEDFLFIGIYFLIFYLLGGTGLVHDSLMMPYYIWNVFIGLVLVLPTKSPQRKLYMLLIYRIKKSRQVQRYFGAEAQEKEAVNLV